MICESDRCAAPILACAAAFLRAFGGKMVANPAITGVKLPPLPWLGSVHCALNVPIVQVTACAATGEENENDTL